MNNAYRYEARPVVHKEFQYHSGLHKTHQLLHTLIFLMFNTFIINYIHFCIPDMIVIMTLEFGASHFRYIVNCVFYNLNYTVLITFCSIAK